MGHGDFEPESGEGAILFGGPGGRRPVTGRHLAAKVKDLDALRLVVLNACETAVVGGKAAQDPFAGVAAALVLGGMPAVVAMQSSIRDAHAVVFTAAFYRRLARGMSVEEAVTEGRQAILSQEPETASWAIPVLFLRAAGDLFARERQMVSEPDLLPPPPARPRGRSLPARAFLLGLLVVALGLGLIQWIRARSSLDEAAFAPLATRPKIQPEKSDRTPQPPPPRPTVSPAPAGGTKTVVMQTPSKRVESAAPVRWKRLVLAIPAGFQDGTVLVDGAPARVLVRLPNYIDIQIPDADRMVAVRVEGRGRVCEKSVLSSAPPEKVNICGEGH